MNVCTKFHCNPSSGGSTVTAGMVKLNCTEIILSRTCTAYFLWFLLSKWKMPVKLCPNWHKAYSYSGFDWCVCSISITSFPFLSHTHWLFKNLYCIILIYFNNFNPFPFTADVLTCHSCKSTGGTNNATDGSVPAINAIQCNNFMISY